MTETRFTVPPDHPALPGHFPGRPIVPGVLLLDAVLRAVEAMRSGDPPTRLLRAKFPAPVAPGAEIRITLAPRGADRIGFTAQCAGTTVLVGEFGWTAPA